MKKGTKLAALLLGLALVIPACTTPNGGSSKASNDVDTTSEEAPVSSEEGTSEGGSSSEAPVNYTVSISNKEELQAEWFVGDQSRKVNIEVEPKANVTQLVKDGVIKITSSNPEVLAVDGQMASPVAAGEATITVKAGESQDTVAITLQRKQTVQEKYGVTHAGTADDPFTNEEALVVAKSDKYNNEDFYVGGTIASFYHAPGSRTDGAVSWFLKPADGQTEKFEIYKCYKATGTGAETYLTDDDVWVNGYAIAHGTFTSYQGQYETNGAKFVSCEGNKPQPRQTLTKSFADTLADGAALADGADSYDYYKFQGYVTKKSGNDFYLTATKGEALVSGKSDADHGERDIYTNAIELYGAGSNADVAAKLLEGAKVEVTMIIKNYHGTVENLLALTADDISVIEPGQNWAVPEPSVATKTIAEFKALENTKANAYYVEGTVKDWGGATAEKGQYGNMTLTDGTNDLVIYGASATATALAWDNASAYAFTNPKDFLTNETTAALNIGDTVTMKLIRADYTKDGVTTIQGTGVITKVVPAGQQVNYTLIEKFDFASSLTAYEAYNADKMNAFIKGSSSLGENTNYVGHVNGKDADSTLTDPLIGANGTISSVKWANYNNLKLGSTSKNAKITLNFKDGTAISKVTMKVAGWPGKTCKLGVNGGEQVAIASATTAASLEDETAFGSYVFELDTPAKSLVLETTLAVMISEMELYAIEGGQQQQEVAQPNGNYSGYAVYAVDDSNLFVNIALSNDLAFVEVGSLIKTTTAFTFDKATGALSVNLGDYGTLKATYDEANNKLTNVGIEGAAAAYIKNNNEVSLTGAANLLDCEGTDEVLQAVFKRRVGSNENGKVVADTEHFAGGKSGVKVPGNSSGDVRLNMRNDLAAAFASKNVGFWVYNPSANQVTIRLWVYKGTGLSNNAELVNGGVKLNANGWTYVRVGTNNASIYNFQIGDFSNSGVDLTFDNICMF